jgi:hypothetical protein
VSKGKNNACFSAASPGCPAHPLRDSQRRLQWARIAAAWQNCSTGLRTALKSEFAVRSRAQCVDAQALPFKANWLIS